MPFQNQFSLTLELTKLVPLGLAAVGKSYEAAMRLARDLQSSGSDIVVEEDLAELLGRARITDSVTSSFRGEMSKPDPSVGLAGSFVLFRGPGPTIVNQPTSQPWFSASSLAAMITNYMETLAEETPSHIQRRTVPSIVSVKGTLQACEDQTATYQWHWRMQLLSVAATLGLHESELQSPVPAVVIQGLIVTLPLIQTLPDDRFVMIETTKGTCTIVVWAHILLGLRVAVRFYSKTDDKYVEIRFPRTGENSDQVIVYMETTHHCWTTRGLVPYDLKPSLTMLSTTTQEQLFQLNADPRFDTIRSNFKTAARGYAQNILEKFTPRITGGRKVMEELRHLSCSFAFCLAQKMVRSPWSDDRPGTAAKTDSGWEFPGDEPPDLAPFHEPMPLHIATSRILDVACILFDLKDHQISSTKCDQYAELYSEARLFNIPDAPSSISTILAEWAKSSHSMNVDWSYLSLMALKISILLLAFANIQDYESCSDLPLSGNISIISQSETMEQIQNWDGQQDFSVSQNAWFEVIALLMVGDRGDAVDMRTTALLSENGWSLYISSLGDLDPSYVGASTIVTKRGIPWRHGIYKHRIIDGPRSGVNEGRYWEPRATHPDMAQLECVVPIEYGRPMIGEQHDNFVIQLVLQTLNSPAPTPEIRWTGYYDLWSSLWLLLKTTRCQHSTRLGGAVELRPGWVTVAGFAGLQTDDQNRPDLNKNSLTIFLTAGSHEARWNAILDMAETCDFARYQVFLRRLDTCFACAAEEASA